MEKRKLGIIGSGKLAKVIAEAWKNGFLPEYELVGIYGRNPETASALAESCGCRVCGSVEQLMELQPDYIAEAASVQAVRDYAEQILRGGASLVVLAIGAFADTAFYEKVRETAARSGTRVYIASGAIGGFDVLRTISLMGEATASIESLKSPGALQNTPLFEEHLLTDREPSRVFTGDAREAIGLLPTKVNVAVATALATVGPEQTDVRIQSIPGYVGDEHRIRTEIDGYRAAIDVYSRTSAIAGWSVVAVLQNLASPIVF